MNRLSNLNCFLIYFKDFEKLILYSTSPTPILDAISNFEKCFELPPYTLFARLLNIILLINFTNKLNVQKHIMVRQISIILFVNNMQIHFTFPRNNYSLSLLCSLRTIVYRCLVVIRFKIVTAK